jgi:hypothetical protein
MTITRSPLYAVMVDTVSDSSATVEHQLSKQSLRQILIMAHDLSDAEVTERMTDLVCAMVPSPYATVDSLLVAEGFRLFSEAPKGDLREVDGPKGCWVWHHIYPTDEKMQETAYRLKSLIKILATELLQK